MNARRILVALIIVAAVAAAGIFVYQQLLAPKTPAAEPTAAPDAIATDGDADVVMAEGEITPQRHTALSFAAGGRVSEVLVEEGEGVRAGQPLLRLEAADMEMRLREAQAALEAAMAGLESARTQRALAQAGVETAQAGVKTAQASLALIKAPPSSEAVGAAESAIHTAEASITQAEANRDAVLNVGTAAQIRAAEANVAAAEAETRALEDFYNNTVLQCVTVEVPTPGGNKVEKEICPLYGWVEENSRFQLEAARAKLSAARAALKDLRAGPTLPQRQAAEGVVDIAEAQRGVAQAQLDLLLAPTRPELVRQAELDVERAELGVAQAQVTAAEAEAAAAQAEARVQAAQAAVDGVQAALDKMTLRAVFDGTVAELSAELGQVLAPGVPVVTLADLDNWVVETTDLIELDVVDVTVGAPVEVQFDAFPDVSVPGEVTHIADTAFSNRGDVTYAVTIALDEEPGIPLRWGMTAFLRIRPQS